jgi:hypothetical protein
MGFNATSFVPVYTVIQMNMRHSLKNRNNIEVAKYDITKMSKKITKVANELGISSVYRDIVVELILNRQSTLIECKDIDNKVFVLWCQIYLDKQLRKCLKNPLIMKELNRR